MAFDSRSKYFITRIDDCAELLSQEKLDTLQGLIKKVDINRPRPWGYIDLSKGETPQLYKFVEGLFEDHANLQKLNEGQSKK